MPTYVLKATPERDLYCLWSTGVDGPTWWGTRAEILELLVEQDEKKEQHARPEVEARLARADATGTSGMHPGAGQWDDDLIFQMAGTLPRARLVDFLDSYAGSTDEDGVHDSWDLSLLEPFDP